MTSEKPRWERLDVEVSCFVDGDQACGHRTRLQPGELLTVAYDVKGEPKLVLTLSGAPHVLILDWIPVPRSEPGEVGVDSVREGDDEVDDRR